MNFHDTNWVCCDNGLFVSLAERLSRQVGTVLYHPLSWRRGFPSHNEIDVGSGLDGIEVVESLWDALGGLDKEKSILLFPDVLHGDLQEHLRSAGWRVFGSGRGDELELYRIYSKKVLKQIGMPVQPYRVIKGIQALREYLNENEKKHVKVSLLRGITETFASDEGWMIEPRLDELQYTLGMIRKYTQEFLVEDEIPTKIELGGDTIGVDGQWPQYVCNGVERKDTAYGCVVQDFDSLPDELTSLMEALSPVMKQYRYRNFFSSEVRVAKDGTGYPIDLTCRQPSPGGECEQELYANLPDMIWAAAEGELVQPELSAPCAVQAMIYSDRADDNWMPIRFPEEIRQWVKLYYHCRANGHDYHL